MDYTISEAVDKIYSKVTKWFEQLIVMLPNLLVAIVIIFAFFWIGRFIKRIIDKPLHRISHSETLVELVLNFVVFSFTAVGIFIGLSILQLDKAVTSLLAGAGIIGIALSFAFQDIAANFISGILLAVRRPIRVGDIVSTNDFFGLVLHINLRSTIIKTMQGQHVFIPNKDIFTKPIVNYTVVKERRIDLECGISYGEDLEKVKEVTLGAITSLNDLLKGKEVKFYYTEFGDSSINFNVHYWISYTEEPNFLEARSEGIIKLKKAFDENGITIPFPIRTLDFGIKGGEKLVEQIKEFNGKKITKNQTSIN